MRNFLHDLLFPHFHNNFRSRFLHHKNILLTIIVVFFSSFLFSFLSLRFPQVLGISSDITIQELLTLTNQKRSENKIGLLRIDEKLSEAASKKADDMFSENYWAHNSPSGKTPWVFIKGEGYTYVYAGENLARGFSHSTDVVNAWMGSFDHRENMLSKNYTDVGFSVKKGRLSGEETVLIVEMLGSTTLSGGEEKVAVIPPSSEQNLVLNSKVEKPLFDSVSLSRNFAIIVATAFLIVLFLDMIIVERQKLTRFVGHNLDHILFFAAIVLIIIVIGKGIII